MRADTTDDDDTTPFGARPHPRGRVTHYYLESDANGPWRLFRHEPGGERWMPDGTWQYSAYTYITFRGLGGDAHDAPEVDAEEVPAIKAALADRWRKGDPRM